MPSKIVSKTPELKTLQEFKAIYDACWEKVYAVCYNNTRNVELSQDMTQEIFTSLWERRNDITIQSSIEHYLVRAAKYKVSEYYRNKTIRTKHKRRMCQALCTSAECTKEDVDYSLLVQRLGLLVEELPCRCQQVYRMSREEGLTNKEIARELEISQRAVEYHISNALGFLKEKLPEYELT